MLFDTSQLNPQEIYRLLVGGVTPRPIAWISTLSKTGVANIAPYSFFNVASCNPPILWYSQVNPREGGDKDTLVNLLDTKECVVHIVNAQLLEKMNQTCASLPADHSEFDFAHLEQCASHSVKPPSVRGTLVRYECTLREVVRFSSLPMGGSAALLDVKTIFVDDAVWQDGFINQAQLKSVGKMGSDFYSLTNDLVELSRP